MGSPQHVFKCHSIRRVENQRTRAYKEMLKCDASPEALFQWAREGCHMHCTPEECVAGEFHVQRTPVVPAAAAAAAAVFEIN